MKRYQMYQSILEGYQAYAMAGSCDIHKENKAAAECFNGVAEDGEFEEIEQLPKYHWFVCRIDSMDAELHYDYGADYYFLIREVEAEGS